MKKIRFKHTVDYSGAVVIVPLHFIFIRVLFLDVVSCDYNLI